MGSRHFLGKGREKVFLVEKTEYANGICSLCGWSLELGDQSGRGPQGWTPAAGEALSVHGLNILSVEADFHDRGQRNLNRWALLNLLGGCSLCQVP